MITELRFTALSYTSASIQWAVPTRCGNLFHIQISIHCFCENVYNTTSHITSVNVTGLTLGVQYSVIVFSSSAHDGKTAGNRANLLMTLDGTYHT